MCKSQREWHEPRERERERERKDGKRAGVTYKISDLLKEQKIILLENVILEFEFF